MIVTDIAAKLRRLADELDQDKGGPPLQAYQLLKPLPGLPSGVVFVHDKTDSVKGSIGCGCLKLAWDDGNCQGKDDQWCAETHVFPGQLAENREWFKPVKNHRGRYYCDNGAKRTS